MDEKSCCFVTDHRPSRFCGIAVYAQGRSMWSGTGMTVNYARKKGLPLTLIHPDTAEVTSI